MVSAAPTNQTTNAVSPKPPAKKGKKSNNKSVKKKNTYPQLKTVPLVPGTAEVVASNVNVRGQAKLKSEVITRVTKGQQVTVLEEIVRNNSGPEEPSAWAKILLPPNAHVWVSSAFIDPTNHTVKPKRLNLRSGAGENYSVLGRLEQGAEVKELNTKGTWTEIEAPTNTFAFIAAQYLRQEAPAIPTTNIAAAPTEPPAPPTTVTEPPTVTTTPGAPTLPTPAEPVANPPAATNPPTATTAAPEIEEPAPLRIVQHEGVVRGITSIQAPTHFALISPENGKTINYLYTTSPELDLRRYKGLHIIVTGEEGLDERWKNTPVITIQRIQVVD